MNLGAFFGCLRIINLFPFSAPRQPSLTIVLLSEVCLGIYFVSRPAKPLEPKLDYVWPRGTHSAAVPETVLLR